ncbi:Nuclear cap-binding protein subunit 3 [Rhizoctonia solani]|uniref:Nuclear cap-binding protein subunit 3 n=1 Tax=Rhizoctonia solani TaxID=456999 RepID=A0A8H7IKQ4_9AGAM|nr:Nuclear cap-binding protein subunit 3 [Rhizoctonia solani]
MWGRAGAYCDGPNVHLIALQLAHHCTMPMYADLLEAGKSPALDFVLPYDQPEVRKDPEERLNEIEQLAKTCTETAKRRHRASCEYTRWKNMHPFCRADWESENGSWTRSRRLMSVRILMVRLVWSSTKENKANSYLCLDDKLRPDALLLHGEVVLLLHSALLLFTSQTAHFEAQHGKDFEYVATYCDSPPTSLEWIDDRTTVIVFESPTAAKSAFPNLATRSADEPEPESQSETLVPAHPVPKKMWPPEAQLDHNLSRGTALSGIMRIRWAMFGDRKLKGARKRSEWYTQQRTKRSRPGGAGGDDLDAELDEMKRRREAGDEEWEAERTAALDRELDALAARKDGDEENMEVESASRLQSRLGPRKNVSRPIARCHVDEAKDERPRRKAQTDAGRLGRRARGVL